MPRYIDQSDISLIANSIINLLQRKGIIVAGQMIGFVTNGSLFPITRPDGTPLKDLDYVKPTPDSTFPFTINTVTFPDRNAKAIYNTLSNSWALETGSVHSTIELEVADAVQESLSGTALRQSVINTENKEAINGKLNRYVGPEHAGKLFSVNSSGYLVPTNTIVCGHF